ncbi:MAG: gamma-glutamylcyclotransferase [Microcoleus sp. PH2017_29_MFU_D_A]|jgi:gamma-glutamylaminecyclotransferase|uniref:allophanate hydrolase-related protein n=1 Tax=unclassified Microcoleus TaxID=2642155 RepID=UPI001D596E6E|nr:MULTISPECIES: gamma-glutamylcyclotransferase [unclassified Microcoleus]MCC3417475.1 gamma-glutamylcyclotransferase [Microcoleus sp. PH2017_07_MST_O_A]MCC3430842.1 gamma-glutamylcyclotransferase [Microcoleus sp. PH2017_04_SCI_O_A]MCC3442713.1 gamma-glutamylcyclotransferase [Microcoleus sp. PH2017_03_ELD_O_A]MCC3468191.1 gamma-glutamylcyclotransferase [Microcoleus sp. PH2017_06_SFM_O_A]MCC3505212.1 gamma-glutamylcyclotransferase [Microcoleus sp. PH2017_19_SFW_U_A]MCC3510200.1 gamma-glutamylc
MSQTPIVSKRVFICGSALRGQPDNSNLGEAKFIREAKTRPIYRLYSAENGWHPAIYEVATGGVSIPGEVYELTVADFEQLAAGEPPHMYPSDVILEDGEVLTAFLYPRELVEKYQWEDISDRGGWAAYKAISHY